VQVSDEAELQAVCSAVLEEYSEQAEAYRSGKTKLMGLFVGQVMKKTEGIHDRHKYFIIIIILLEPMC
jgi:aspartyl-tRNA(Asn)/glutamyl-tRNA(Gln) amidotransferase subunit B